MVFKEITRAVVLALREELALDNKDVLGKLSEVEEKLTYGGKALEENISSEPHNNLCRKADGLYAGTNYVTTESSPVGEIIAFMGTAAPEHYLSCDGTEYPIGSYPLLEAFFTDQFGSVNYFGGNGTDTFAVPDLRGEFLRGAGTATRNTGTGSKVGGHQNGTINPGLWHESQNKLYFGTSDSFDKMANSYLVQYADKNYHPSDLNGTIRRAQNFTVQNIDSIQPDWVFGYTSRPTNTSVLYCIKYEPTYYTAINDNDENLSSTMTALTNKVDTLVQQT